MGDFLDLSHIVVNFVTALGIVAGAAWALYRFGVTRQAVPKATIRHTLMGCELPDGQRLIRVVVHITNTGYRRLVVEKMFVRVQQIAPCDPSDIQKLLCRKNREGEWRMLADKSAPDHCCDLEQGEDDFVGFEFIIPRDPDIISVYSHVESPHNPDVGWTYESWHRCKEITL